MCRRAGKSRVAVSSVVIMRAPRCGEEDTYFNVSTCCVRGLLMLETYMVAEVSGGERRRVRVYKVANGSLFDS